MAPSCFQLIFRGGKSKLESSFPWHACVKRSDRGWQFLPRWGAQDCRGDTLSGASPAQKWCQEKGMKMVMKTRWWWRLAPQGAGSLLGAGVPCPAELSAAHPPFGAHALHRCRQCRQKFGRSPCPEWVIRVSPLRMFMMPSEHPCTVHGLHFR